MGELDRVSRNENLTMEQLYREVYGYVEYNELDTEDWSPIYIAGNEDYWLVATVPDALYETLEVNEEQTGVSMLYFGDSYGIGIVADVDLDDYSGMTDEEYEELSDMLTEILTEEVVDAGYVPEPGESTAGVINDAYWRVYAVTGYDEDSEMDSYLLLYLDDNAMLYVMIDIVILFDENYDDTSALMSELFYEIVSSLEVEIGYD